MKLFVTALLTFALGLATGARLASTRELPNGRLEFLLDRIPHDFIQRVLNDEITVSGKRFIDAMEVVLAILAARRRCR